MLRAARPTALAFASRVHRAVVVVAVVAAAAVVEGRREPDRHGSAHPLDQRPIPARLRLRAGAAAALDPDHADGGLLKNFDMYVPGAGGYDVGLHAQTGHPCAVVPYKFEPQPAGSWGRAARPWTRTTPAVTYNPQPICAVLAGNLYNDDKILSVAHQYQIHTDWHTETPVH